MRNGSHAPDVTELGACDPVMNGLNVPNATVNVKLNARTAVNQINLKELNMCAKEVDKIELLAYICIIHFKDGSRLEINSEHEEELMYWYTGKNSDFIK